MSRARKKRMIRMEDEAKLKAKKSASEEISEQKANAIRKMVSGRWNQQAAKRDETEWYGSLINRLTQNKKPITTNTNTIKSPNHNAQLNRPKKRSMPTTT